MSANDGVECRVPSAGIKPWFYLQKLGFFCIKTKNPMHQPEKVGFFPPLHGSEECVGPLHSSKTRIMFIQDM